MPHDRLGLRNLLRRCDAARDVHHGHGNRHVHRKLLQHWRKDHDRNGARAMTRKKLTLARLRDESGTAAVEFAIVASVFITLLIGIAYASIMLHSNAALQWAVETAARTASLNPAIT